MKRILSIETSTKIASVSLTEGEEVLAEHNYESQRSHNSKLFHPLEEILVANPTLDLIVVGQGPGSYTGARIGIAAALALSKSKQIPLYEIPTVLGLSNQPFELFGDARRDQFYHASIDPSKIEFESEIITKNQLMERYNNMTPTHDIKITEQNLQFLSSDLSISKTPSATELALTFYRIISTTSIAPPKVVSPIYLQSPFITTPKKRIFGQKS